MDQPSAPKTKPNHEIEVKLLNNGPVFEAGPGWGAKTGSWLKKYFFKVILPIVVAALVVWGLTQNNGVEQTAQIPLPTGEEKISQEVKRGESRTHLARRALVEYLSKFPEELTKGQKVFIEDKLRRLVTLPALKAGMAVDFLVADIKTAIEESRQLTKSQLQKWEEYARNVRF